MGVTPEEAGLERIPTCYKSVTGDDLAMLEKLIEVIEDDPDVVNLYHNLEE